MIVPKSKNHISTTYDVLMHARYDCDRIFLIEKQQTTAEVLKAQVGNQKSK